LEIFKNKAKRILEKYQIRPKKKMGQNFIFDKNILNKIVNVIEPLDTFLIVEIGPGPGGLTNILYKREPKNLVLIEKDKEFKNILTDLGQQYFKTNTVTIFEDILKLDLYGHEIFKKNQIKFISNLPYYISTQILLKILPFKKNIIQAVFMFQKEVAERILSKPNNKDYSRLSVITQYSCEIKKELIVKSNVFFPKPDVDSCVLSFKPRKEVNPEDFNIIQKITKLAFQKRRKTIKNSLSCVQGIESALETLNIHPQSRAENLSILQYKKLASLLRKKKLI